MSTSHEQVEGVSRQGTTGIPNALQACTLASKLGQGSPAPVHPQTKAQGSAQEWSFTHDSDVLHQVQQGMSESGNVPAQRVCASTVCIGQHSMCARLRHQYFNGLPGDTQKYQDQQERFPLNGSTPLT